MNKFDAIKAKESAQVALDYFLERKGDFFEDPSSCFEAKATYLTVQNKPVIRINASEESYEPMLQVLQSRDLKKKSHYYDFTIDGNKVELVRVSRHSEFADFASFEDLNGLTITSITVQDYSDETVYIRTECGRLFRMNHHQSCCESVEIEEIVGDLEDVIGTPILLAEEITEDDAEDENGLYTFYKLATVKGDVSIRWYGSSNGYYSVSVSFEEIVL